MKRPVFNGYKRADKSCKRIRLWKIPVTSLADANALMVLPGGTRGYEAGARVHVLLYRDENGSEQLWPLSFRPAKPSAHWHLQETLRRSIYPDRQAPPEARRLEFLIEGFKHAPYQKVVMVRNEADCRLLKELDGIIAVIYQQSEPKTDVPIS